MARNKKAESLIEQGIAALRAGQQSEGRELLRQAAQNDPRSVQAWLWLSAAVEGVDDQRQCLYKVLEIEPNNSLARSGLAFLSRLRVGEEWRADAAPWIMGMEEKAVATHPCPHCQAENPVWAYTCSRCGALLQPVDILKTAKTEMQVEGRFSAAPAVMLSWPSAAVLNRQRTFEPEVGHASLVRSLTALLLGSLLLALFRAGMTLATGLLAGYRLLPLLGRLAGAVVLEEGIALVAATAVALAATLLTWLSSRLVGGKGGPLVHLHLVAVSVSSWLAITAAAALAAWGLSFAIQGEILTTAKSVLVALLALYGFVLLSQAVQTAQRVHPVLATVCVAVAATAAALVYLGLGNSLTELLENLRDVGYTLLAPITI